jgi:hypothetical protein
LIFIIYMPNPIKYSTGTETLALKKGNFYIGTGAVGKGPTSETGYYNGITPPTGGYTIYLNKESNGPSIYTASNDAELISLTNSIAGQSYTTAQQCFNYFYGQTDKLLVNQDYPADYPYIVMDGLILNLDAGITQSYPGSGTTWTDINGLGPKNNGTLINGPAFNSDNGGGIVFDGSNDYALIPISNHSTTPTITVEGFIKWVSLNSGMFLGFNNNDVWTYQNTLGFNNGASNVIGISANDVSNLNLVGNYHHYAFVMKQNQLLSTFKMYIDTNSKTLTPQVNLDGNSASFTSNIALGSWTRDGGGGFNGNVEFGCLRIYNRELTQSEITQNYNTQKGRFGL